MGMNATGDLPLGVRVIRRLVPPDAPWPSSSVRTVDDSAGMLVDAALLEHWEGFDAGSDGHVLGPLDLVRRPDGHDVLLPLCVERVVTLLRRRSGGAPLSSGEVITLAVSVLRGMAEIAQRDGHHARGSWWLTDEGRPVFVDHDDGDPAGDVSGQVLATLAAECPTVLREPLAVASSALRDLRVLARELDEVEQALFAVAAPEPIATAPLSPARPATVGVRLDTASDLHPDQTRSWATTMVSAVDTDLADAFSQATTRLWRRLRRPVRTGHARPWVWAGCLAAGVIVAGLAWPAPGEPAAGADSISSSATPARDEVTTSAPEPAVTDGAAGTGGAATVAPDQPPDAVGVVDALLEARRRCVAGGGGECLGGIVEDPGRAIPAGAVDATTGERTLILVEDFGGVAVVRVDPADGRFSAQLVTVVQAGGRWLVRDVHDIEHHP